ncbi:MAG: T9SS type A sorting domain-containing protein [Bacteroidota bacterium]
MKKIFFIFLLAVIGLTAKSFGQGTCQNAQNLYPSDTAIQLLSANDTIAWYIYQATTPNLTLQVSMLDTLRETVSGIYIYSGNCDNFTLVDSSHNAYNLMLNINTLTIGNIYYVKITKPALTPSVKFILDIWTKILNCSDIIYNCRDGQSSSPITPGYNCDLVCNGNFEYYTSIPTYTSQIGLACPWGSVNDASPDYFNADAINLSNPSWPGNEVGVPKNNFCNNQPDMITGHKGYAGFGVALSAVGHEYYGYQEYIYEPLKEALLPGLEYTVTFNISRACEYKYAVDNIGVFLSENYPYIGSNGQSGQNITHSIPYNTDFPYQTWIWKDNYPLTPYMTNINWTTITYNVFPTYPINYIVIGGFGPVTYTSSTGWEQGAYYYIDEVHIVPVPPNLTITANPNPICSGYLTTLSSNLNTPINWSSNPTCNILNPTNSISTNAIPIASSPTTFTFTGTLQYAPQSGCILTANTTVNVVDPPVPTISGTSNFCTGGSTTYYTEAGKTGYVWSITGGTIISGQGSYSIVVTWTSNGTNTISVNYSNYVCTAASPTILQVTVGPIPPPIITGLNNNCDLTTTYTASNIYNTTNFTWNITNDASCPQCVFQTDNVSVTWNDYPLLTNTTPGEVKVTYIDPNGCSASSFIEVYACCGKDGSTNLHDPNKLYKSGDIPSAGNTFFINGTVTFDDNIVISNQTVYLGPYAKINVTTNHKLTIDAQSTLSCRHEGCNFMWDGIYVNDDNTYINVQNGSTIEDAINGLVSDKDGIINIDNSYMTDNYYSVKINNSNILTSPLPGYSVTYVPYLGSFTNTKFNFVGDITTHTHLNYPPMNNSKSLVGVYCNDAHNINIGDETSPDLKNTFDKLRYGIYAYNSDINVVNDEFTNIVNGGYAPPFQTYDGVDGWHKFYAEGAIYAFDDMYRKTIFQPNKLIVGGSIAKRNYFDNCKTGIFSYGYENYLNNNDFNNCVNGIDLVDIRTKTDIEDNSIYSSLTTLPLVKQGKGISVRNTIYLIKGSNCLIMHNDITDKVNGISLMSVNSALPYSGIDTPNLTEITDNKIMNFYQLNTPIPIGEKHCGITAADCYGITISMNLISRNLPIFDPLGDYDDIRGIWLTDCQNAYVFQNHLINMGNGILTNGHLEKTMFDCNKMDENYYGFRFWGGSVITNQGILIGNADAYNPCNEWNNFNPPPLRKRMYDDQSGGLISPGFTYFYDNTADPKYNPNPKSGIYINPAFNQNAICKCNKPTGTGLDPVGYSVPDNLDAREAAMGQIVRDEKIYTFLEEQYKETDREYVYDILRKNLSIVNMGGTDDNVYLQFYDLMKNSDYGMILKMQESVDAQNMVLAKQMLEQVVGDDFINNNRKIVDNIYLDTWASGIYNFTDDQYNTLYDIATLTPYAGGNAVYTARVMLNLDPTDLNMEYAKPPAHNQPIVTENTVKVYPNPAHKQFTIEFKDVINNALIEVYSSMGNLVFTDNMKGVYIKNIDVSNLNDGFYFYKITINGTKFSSGKLTILKK